MQTLLLRGTQGLTRDQKRIVGGLMTFAMIMVWIISNWCGDEVIGVQTNVISKMTFNEEKAQSEMDIESAYKSGLSVAKLSGLGGMGEMQTDVVEFNFEKEIYTNPELNDALTERQSVLSRIENRIESQIQELEIENAKRAQLESITCDPTDITKVSNLTEEQIGMMVEDTWLEGQEHTLYQVEQEEGINVFFIYAVSTLESDHGTSYRATSRHNYYGLETTKNYGSYENNTRYFGDMMNRLYISKGNVGVSDINPIYCPPNRNWDDSVTEIMNAQYEKITTLTLA